MTARQAIGDLADEGVLTRRQGRGTFVARPKITQRLRRLTGFTADVAARGVSASSERPAAAQVAAPDDLARDLGVRARREVVCIERLRKAASDPIALNVLG